MFLFTCCLQWINFSPLERTYSVFFFLLLLRGSSMIAHISHNAIAHVGLVASHLKLVNKKKKIVGLAPASRHRHNIILLTQKTPPNDTDPFWIFDSCFFIILEI